MTSVAESGSALHGRATDTGVKLEGVQRSVVTFGDALFVRRQELGLSLQDVADRTGGTKAHVWELESGRSTNPTVKTLLGLAAALEMDPVELFRAAANPASKPKLGTPRLNTNNGAR